MKREGTSGFTGRQEAGYAGSLDILDHCIFWITYWGWSSMHKTRSGVLAATVFLGMIAGLFTQNLFAPNLFAQTSTGSSAMPKVGDVAPDFTLKYFDGTDLKPVKLSDFRGKKNVVVAFYVFAFTGG
jgi:hypothetical protein